MQVEALDPDPLGALDELRDLRGAVVLDVVVAEADARDDDVLGGSEGGEEGANKESGG